MPKRIYLAGPEVFLRDPRGQGARKKEICARYGFEGAFPMDTMLKLTIPPGPKDGWIISKADEAMMDGCDLIVANMTPFRGPSMDVGTAFEMGYMRAQGKPVFGYSNVAANYHLRVREFFGADKIGVRPDGRVLEDPDGNMLEHFDMASGAEIVAIDVPAAVRFTDLRAFELCLQRAKALLG
jgi:nucleoside 2-deoxyribosyltransferase